MDKTMIAYPSDGNWIVTCSDCDLLAVATEAEVDALMHDHHAAHAHV